MKSKSKIKARIEKMKGHHALLVEEMNDPLNMAQSKTLMVATKGAITKQIELLEWVLS